MPQVRSRKRQRARRLFFELASGFFLFALVSIGGPAAGMTPDNVLAATRAVGVAVGTAVILEGLLYVLQVVASGPPAVFISYRFHSRDRAVRLRDALRAENLRCELVAEHLDVATRRLPDELAARIVNRADFVVLLDDAEGRSHWVDFEVSLAIRNWIVPIVVAVAGSTGSLGSKHWRSVRGGGATEASGAPVGYFVIDSSRLSLSGVVAAAAAITSRLRRRFTPGSNLAAVISDPESRLHLGRYGADGVALCVMTRRQDVDSGVMFGYLHRDAIKSKIQAYIGAVDDAMAAAAKVPSGPSLDPVTVSTGNCRTL